jgi:hypothetical protein
MKSGIGHRELDLPTIGKRIEYHLILETRDYNSLTQRIKARL